MRRKTEELYYLLLQGCFYLCLFAVFQHLSLIVAVFIFFFKANLHNLHLHCLIQNSVAVQVLDCID